MMCYYLNVHFQGQSVKGTERTGEHNFISVSHSSGRDTKWELSENVRYSMLSSPEGLSLKMKILFKNFVLRVNFQGISITLQLRRRVPEEPFMSPYPQRDEIGFC